MARGTNSPKHKGMSYTKFGYIFIAPFVLVYCIFSLYPLFNTFWYSGANMTSTTADFWGFSDKDVYYDRYLDLSTLYTSDFEGDVGMPLKDYNIIRSFFATQNAADLYNPLDKAGIKAIIANGANEIISQGTIDKLQQCLDNGSLSYLDNDAFNELKAWKKDFNDKNSETTNITSAMSSIFNTLDAIVNPEATEADENAEPLTPDSIVNAETIAALIENINAIDKTDANNAALVNYLEGIAGTDLVSYFEDAQDNPGIVSDPNFYYICSHLANPNAYYEVTDEDGEVDTESISGITVPFLNNLTKYLTENEWAGVINNIGCLSTVEDYASGTVEIPAGADTGIYSDLQELENAGIINKVKLIVDGDTLKPMEDKKGNVLFALENYIPSTATAEERKAAAQILAIQNYWEDSGRQNMTGIYQIAVDQYITFKGDFSISKYRDFKKTVTMSDGRTLASVFTLSFYEDLDQAKRDKAVADAKTAKAEAQAALPAAQDALNAAKATGDAVAIKAAAEEVDKLKGVISSSNEIIGCPVGILSKVDASTEYLFVGGQNFKNIFTSIQRRNSILGAFVTTAEMWLIGFVPQIALALLLSAWFTDTKLNLKGLNLMKGLMYLPNVITAVTVAIFFRKIFSYSTNEAALPPSQIVLRAFGDKDGFNFFQKPWPTRLIVCFINFWMWYGNTMIVLIAGITSINESLYESAQIDGANSFQTYTKITMPLLRPILLYTMVTSMIGGLQMYDIPQNVNMNSAVIKFNGTPIKSVRTVLMYVNDMAFGAASRKQVGIGSATSVILFVVTIILSIVIFYLMRDKDAAKAAKAKKLARKAGAAK